MVSDPAVSIKSAQGRWTLIAVVLGSGVVFLDTTVVNLALKEIGSDLPRFWLGKLEGQTYIGTGYFVTLSALLILAGALSDYHGRKRMFGLGLAGFALTSLLCGAAPNMEVLVLFRILQGATGALLVPGSLSIITSTFHGEDRGRAFGLWAGASAFTTIIGPLVGGVLVNSISWRLAFFINLPLLALAYFATVRHVPESRDEESSGHFDWVGALIVIVAVAGLSFGIVRGQETGWSGAAPIVSLVAGVLGAIAFPIWMRRSREPLVPLDLFRSRNFTVTNVSTFVIYGALYVSLTFQGLFLIGTLDYTEPAAGLAGLPATLLLTFFSTRFGRLAARYGPRIFMAIGPALMGLGLLWFLRIPAGSEPWTLGSGQGGLLPPADYFADVFPAMVVFGVGLTTMVAPLTTALMTSVPERNSGVASAINNAVSRVGAPLVGALIFVAVASSFYGSVKDRVPDSVVNEEFKTRVAPLNPPPSDSSPELRTAVREASTDSFRLAMAVASALLLSGAAVNAAGIKNQITAAEGESEPVPAPG